MYWVAGLTQAGGAAHLAKLLFLQEVRNLVDNTVEGSLSAAEISWPLMYEVKYMDFSTRSDIRPWLMPVSAMLRGSWNITSERVEIPVAN
jgi:hypothetical protein